MLLLLDDVTICVGDVMEYYWNCTAGNDNAQGPDRGKITANVTRVSRKEKNYPLTLDTGHQLWSEMKKVRKVKEISSEGNLVGVGAPKWVALNHCRFVDGGEGSLQDVIMK